MSALDKPEKLNIIDKSGMLSDLVNTPEYCRDAIKRSKKVIAPQVINPKNIILVGMGGSAIGGEILHDWLRDRLPVPMEICRDYILPTYVGKDTLVFVISYSGKTEETLTAFLTAAKKKCTVIAITSGGQLEQFCKKLKVPHVIIPSGLQPRVAIPYLLFPLPIFLEKLGILCNIENELEEVITTIEKTAKANAPDVPIQKNKAKQLAIKIVGTMPVIYGFRQYTSIAHRIKTQFNENSKIPSRYDAFPELNHNETVGYEAPESLTKIQSVILLREPKEPTEIKARIETTKSLAFTKAKNVLEIEAEGKGKLAKMLSAMCIGDYVSVYLAILQDIDPTPVKIIDRLKSELAKKMDTQERLKLELTKLE